MSEVVFKKARKKDRTAIARLARELDADDWLPDALDQLYEVDPGLHVALVDDSPVAVCLMSLPRPDQAFLGGMRVAADRQRKGVGQSFTSYLVERAAKLGASVVRLMVEPENEPSSKLVEKLGFRAQADWRVYLGLTLDFDAPASGVAVPGARNLTQVRGYFTGNFRRTNPSGLLATESPWDICDVGWAGIQEAVSARQVLLRHGKDGVEGALIFATGGDSLIIRYFEGEKVAREHLLRHLSRLVRERGLSSVHASLPAPQGLGLEDTLPGEVRGDHHVVYELDPTGAG